MGKSSISGPFSMAMLNHQRVYDIHIYIYIYIERDIKKQLDKLNMVYQHDCGLEGFAVEC